MSPPNRIGALALLAVLALAPALFARLPEPVPAQPLPWDTTGPAGAQPSALEALVLGHKLDLNRAEARDLEVVPGIGPALAQAIVLDRVTRGPFASLHEVTRVKGIGPTRAELLSRYVTVRDPAPSARTAPDLALPGNGTPAR